MVVLGWYFGTIIKEFIDNLVQAKYLDLEEVCPAREGDQDAQDFAGRVGERDEQAF